MLSVGLMSPERTWIDFQGQEIHQRERELVVGRGRYSTKFCDCALKVSLFGKQTKTYLRTKLNKK